MADAPTEQAIAISTGIVDALHAAGVLRRSSCAKHVRRLSRVRGASNRAFDGHRKRAFGGWGLLQAQGTPTTPPAPELEVGDFRSFTVRVLTRSLTSNPDTVKVQLDSYEATPFTYVAELTLTTPKVLARSSSPTDDQKPIGVSAYVKITGKITATKYDCE